LAILAKKPPSDSAIVTKKRLSTEDSALFRQTIGQVKPIKTDTLSLHPKKKPKPYPQKKPASMQLLLENTAIEIEPLLQEDSFSFLAPGLQKNILKKLRRGHFGLDAVLDLHGLTSQQAKRELIRFLYLSVEEGCRCVQVIHGKGYGSQNYRPVLKNDINVWLRQYQSVQAFCSAPPKDGGTGAVFILLKLNEKYGEDE